MGQYADDIINGLVDEITGEIIDGDSPGYPRRKPRQKQNKKPFGCKLCKKRFGTLQGAKDHERDSHGDNQND